jgi:hypothetical protein
MVTSIVVLITTGRDDTVSEKWVSHYFVALYCTQMTLLLLLLAVARCMQLIFRKLSTFTQMMKRWWIEQGKKYCLPLGVLYISISVTLISVYPVVGYLADCYGWIGQSVEQRICAYPLTESAFATARILFVVACAICVMTLFALALCPCGTNNAHVEPELQPQDEEAAANHTDHSESASTDPDDAMNGAGNTSDDDDLESEDEELDIVINHDEQAPILPVPRLIRSQ